MYKYCFMLWTTFAARRNRASENRTLNGFYRLIFPNTAQTHLIIRKYYLHSFVCLEKNQLDKNCLHLMTRKFLVILGSENEVRLPPFEDDELKRAKIVRHKASRVRFPIAWRLRVPKARTLPCFCSVCPFCTIFLKPQKRVLQNNFILHNTLFFICSVSLD